jgi:ATP-binding cassette subfamily A (ABC1) protein 1
LPRKRSAFALLHSICVIYAMSFVPAAFVVYLIEDRISGSKHLQFVSGLPPWLYWIAAYAWDLSSYLVTAMLCVFVFLVFDEEAYVGRDTFPGLLVLMVLYGWATVPLMYPFSFFFETSSFAFVALATANLFIGIVSTISTFVLEIMEEQV